MSAPPLFEEVSPVPHRLRAALCTAGLFFGFLAFASALRAGVDPIKIKALRQQAEFHEQQAEWDKACLVYESILRLDRSLPEIQERYQSGLRRYWQVRRHGDPSYRKEVLGLDYAQALRLYTMIRNTLMDNALDKNTVDPGQLLRKGIEEFDNALTDPYLVRQYVPAVNPRELRAFRDLLKETWARADKLTKQQAVKQVRELALAAQRALHVNASMVVMEFACGACYGLDEYTLYLTPNQLRELCDSLHGEYVGVGLGLRLQNNKIVISEVLPYSPAAEIDDPPVTKDDVVISIDKKPLLAVNVEAAQDLLDGPAGTSVELEIYSPTTGSRSLTLRRRAVFIPSVSHQMKSDQLGYLHIACFQDTTVQEVDDALAALAKEGMKSLILDLRGNGGGVFEAAIDVARRFLATGVIAATQNSDPRFSTVYQAQSRALRCGVGHFDRRRHRQRRRGSGRCPQGQ